MIDFNHDLYEAVLNQLRDECIASDVSPQDLLERHILEEDRATIAAMQLCGELSIGVEQQRVEGLLVTGLFHQLGTRERIGALLLCIEVGKRIEHHSLKERFATYTDEHPLFTRFPSLFDRVRDGELLDSLALNAIGPEGLVELRAGFARLDPLLSPHIVHALAQAFPGAPLYLRLDPEQAWADRPKQLLLETIMVPADPRWWRTLGLFRGEQTGGQYCVIPPDQAADDVDAYLEYHVKGFRKLETIAQRKEPHHLTMMLEELQLLRDGLLIGRCIHLDTNAPSGTPPAQAKVMHVDLAINVYIDSKVGERMASQMNDAEKEKASFRTHLLRAEGVPFEVLTLLSYMFFGSHLMRRDLFMNQFSR